MKKNLKRKESLPKKLVRTQTKLQNEGEMMAAESDFNFEKYVEYYGTIKNVKKQISECNICGAKLSFSHLADYKNMLVQESSRCPECGHKNIKKIHIIN